MCQHERLKDSIQSELSEIFLTDVILHQWKNEREWFERKVLYCPVEEMPVSTPTARIDKLGRPIISNRYIDVVFFVGSGKSAAYHGDVFTIAIEVKSNLYDLQRDEKMSQYVGKTDYCFLGVEDGLIEDALRKVEALPGVGVVSLSTGHIVRLADRQKVDPVMQLQLLHRLLFKQSPNPSKTFIISQESIGEAFQVVPSSFEDAPKGSSNNSNLSLTFKTKTTMNFVGLRTPELRPVRLEPKNGKLVLWKGIDQAPELYDYAEGQLTGIELRRRATRNGEMVYADFHMRNGEELFDISTIASSCVTADLVSRLKNVKDPVNSVLRIDAWQNNRYTNVILRENGHPVAHASLPRVQKVDRGFKVELDSSARDAAVTAIIEELNSKLQPKS